MGRGKRAVSYSGLRLAEGFEACRAPNKSGLRSACPCRWPPSTARRSSSLPGTEAVRHRQNPAEPTALRHPAAWGRPRGGSGRWGGGGTLPGSILGTQPAICRNPVSLLTREPPNTPQFLQIEAQRLLGPLRGTFLSVIWTPAERLARRRAECYSCSDILCLCTVKYRWLHSLLGPKIGRVALRYAHIQPVFSSISVHRGLP